jgi:hypothetical protein
MLGHQSLSGFAAPYTATGPSTPLSNALPKSLVEDSTWCALMIAQLAFQQDVTVLYLHPQRYLHTQEP